MNSSPLYLLPFPPEAQNEEGDAAPVQAVPLEVLAQAFALLPPRDLAAAMCVDRWVAPCSGTTVDELFIFSFSLFVIFFLRLLLYLIRLMFLRLHFCIISLFWADEIGRWLGNGAHASH